ncbi:MAG: YybS family protein [Treponema sp.]|jgi:hypothetical protein|nr:YybS family protein [Treponema sp.]
MRLGFLSFFFLAPLGYAAVAYDSAWFAFSLAAVINIVFSLAARLIFQYGMNGAWIDIFYFTSLSMLFVWIIAGDGIPPRMRTVYRFILASAAGALFVIIFVLSGKNGSDFAALIRPQAEYLSQAAVSSTGSDAVKLSFLQRILTPENIVETIKNAALRGGALAGAFFMFFANRQTAIVAARILKKGGRDEKHLSAFFVPVNTIWVFSSALAVILLARMIKAEILEILAWNALVICGILFLAQGAGITAFFLARRTAAFRLLANVLIILMIFSPGINITALAALLLLGIAEIWLPLRAADINGQAPTPEQ